MNNLKFTPKKAEVVDYLITLQMAIENNNLDEVTINSDNIQSLLNFFKPNKPNKKHGFGWVATAVDEDYIRTGLRYVLSDGNLMFGCDGHRVHYAPADTERSRIGFYCPKTGLCVALGAFVRQNILESSDEQPDDIIKNRERLGLPKLDASAPNVRSYIYNDDDNYIPLPNHALDDIMATTAADANLRKTTEVWTCFMRKIVDEWITPEAVTWKHGDGIPEFYRDGEHHAFNARYIRDAFSLEATNIYGYGTNDGTVNLRVMHTNENNEFVGGAFIMGINI